jgi:integrase/recombinase XerD
MLEIAGLTILAEELTCKTLREDRDPCSPPFWMTQQGSRKRCCAGAIASTSLAEPTGSPSRPSLFNLRLAAIRSFFRYIALEVPQFSGLIQRVLAIPNKRQARPLVGFLIRPEIDALLAVPDRNTWLGRRNHALLLTVIQTGLRLSEITSIRRQDVSLGKGAHIRCEGKGRKERCTPLAKSSVIVLTAWIREQGEDDGTRILFPTAQGGRLSADAVQHLVRKYAAAAQETCPSLTDKRVSPHLLRHTTAMELLQSGVDRTLIALWLGHESVETTQIYLDANLAIKEEILAKTTPINAKGGRYRPDDDLLAFLKGL